MPFQGFVLEKLELVGTVGDYFVQVYLLVGRASGEEFVVGRNLAF